MLKKNKYKKYGGSTIIKIPRRSRHRLRQALEDGTDTNNLADSVLGFRLASSLPTLPRPKVIRTDEYDYLDSDYEPNETFEENSSSGDVSSDEINDIIYAFVIRHNLTKAATQDLLTLIRMINPDLVGIASTKTASVVMRRQITSVCKIRIVISTNLTFAKFCTLSLTLQKLPRIYMRTY
ncbi:unnamed protein product [Allacma fusca]|uniref:Uncharacterized protein n=1 Tax=Allacma fusca TaxID=39272 RepID=A0A8J2PW23_9HEXA|nr:unnamed protein product [Allacma fusca]